MYSNTYGEVTIDKIAEIVIDKIKNEYDAYNIIIGTDSQNTDRTKVVLVIAVYNVGHGGFFFYDIHNINRIDNINKKLIYETNSSLECANRLLESIERLSSDANFDYTDIKLSIHVDAGYNGKTREIIPELVSWVRSYGYDCEVKPESYAASSIADKYSK